VEPDTAHPFLAQDMVSQVLRTPALAKQLMLCATALSGWGMSWPAWDGAMPWEEEFPQVVWSKSGRFVAIHYPRPTHPMADSMLEYWSTIYDTRTLAAVMDESHVFVQRFVDDAAEVAVAARYPRQCAINSWTRLLAADDACRFDPTGGDVRLQTARVSFATSPPTLLRVHR
jgi:hypothetical protein